MQSNTVVVRAVDRMDADRAAVSGLLRDYHLQTEHEKAQHGAVDRLAGAELPARYQAEIDDPASAFAGAVVVVAEGHDGVVGMVALQRSGRDVEVKRLWVAPAGRRRGVAAALMAYAREHAERADAEGLRLSVWDWRADALALYRSQGFTIEPSWESRARLICLRRALR
ncbi:N-acetyltransferase [Microbacterium sp. Ru50]|jgi:ribosomal protein S18 acetylase RimI-like enzyme|uniref:GNAT family N-acetyltransferase n=1 Tax=Microbacterium sp. Ru50 TaxID=2080744 RepID=UPI0021561B16|nr:GNAT family N-acetyltransferase [Microbacterium sp. Ru50]